VPPVLGLDFDNTLICYDEVFHKVARERSLVSEATPKDKISIRDHLRQTGREDAWTELQGEVYGPRIHEATIFVGAFEAIELLMHAGVKICLVSHKTRTPYLGKAHDLHFAATSWLRRHKFFCVDGLNWGSDHVFFETTKQSKISRILSQGCTHFLDDLPEILGMLPEGMTRIQFAPGQVTGESHPWPVIGQWRELPNLVL